MGQALKSGSVMFAMSGGETAVLNHTLVAGINEAKKHGATKIWGALYGIDGILKKDAVNLHDQGPERLVRVAKTPGAALYSKRQEPNEEQCTEMVERFREMDVRYFFFIGGDNTARSAYLINEAATKQNYEMCCIHVPKTIDNDLLVTDHTPGYGSAALYISRAISGIEMGNLGLPAAYIGGTMGKDAGFLAAAAAVRQNRAQGSGPHKIYVPEKDFSLDRFLQDVDETVSRCGRGIFIVAEGVRVNFNGKKTTLAEYLGATLDEDGYGGKTLSGTGAAIDFLVRQVKEKLRIKRVRGQTFGYEQRSMVGVVSRVDAEEAQIAGAWAVRYAAQGAQSGSVALNSLDGRENGANETQLASLDVVGAGKKFMDAKYLSDYGDGISEAGKRYILQLIGEGKIPWVEGLDMSLRYKPSD